MATLEGVVPNVAQRIRWVEARALADPRRKGRPFWITTGQRKMDEQNRLFAAMENAKRRFGSRWRELSGVPLAAFPGRSNHGRILNGVLQPATAVDLACDAVDNALRAELARAAGLQAPIDGEPWHFEEVPGAPLPPADDVQEDDMVRKYVGTVLAPSGRGAWNLTADGAVEAVNFDPKSPIPHFGSMHDFPEERDKSGREFTGIVLNAHYEPATGGMTYRDDLGYTIVANDGIFKFDPSTKKR